MWAIFPHVPVSTAPIASVLLGNSILTVTEVQAPPLRHPPDVPQKRHAPFGFSSVPPPPNSTALTAAGGVVAVVVVALDIGETLAEVFGPLSIKLSHHLNHPESSKMPGLA